MQESHQMKINSCPVKSLKLKVMRKKEKKGEMADSIVIMMCVATTVGPSGDHNVVLVAFQSHRKIRLVLYSSLSSSTS